MYATGSRDSLNIFLKWLNGAFFFCLDTDASDVVIPSVYVAQYQFLSLIQHLQDTQNSSVIIRITKNELFTW